MKDKRGLAIELAIITMFIVFALCIVLVTVAELNYKSDGGNIESSQNYIELDRIGDKCLRNISEGKDTDKDILSKEYEIDLFEITSESDEANVVSSIGEIVAAKKYLITVKKVNADVTLNIKFGVDGIDGEGVNRKIKLSVVEWRRG